MDAPNTQQRVHQCSKCPGNTEYFCETCTFNLCKKCSWNHVPYPKILDHNVGIYRDKFSYIPKQEACVRHPDRLYIKYCEPCELPVCNHCRKHRNHTQLLDILSTYKTKQMQHNRTINIIRTECLLYLPILLGEIKSNVEDCQTKFSRYYSNMLKKVQILKNMIDKVIQRFDFKLEINSYVSSIQEFEQRYEHASTIPIQFIKQKYELESLNKKVVIKLLTDIKFKENGKRCVLRLMSAPEAHSVSLAGLDCCYNISCVTSDRVWVNDFKNLILANRTGDTLYQRRFLRGYGLTYGLHTLNNDSELIYIDEDDTIKKLSKDFKTTTQTIEKKDASWTPVCLFFSQNTGDLLAGMRNTDTQEANVTRYNQNGQMTQTIQGGNTDMHLFEDPTNITENNNGDIVVSDYEKAVVVTERGGSHRFTYKGHPLGSMLHPSGLCTDALSHILVCDQLNQSVQMLDKDGRFLSHLLLRQPGIFLPSSLCYDVKTHHIWVGSLVSKKMCVLRYLSRQHALTCKYIVSHVLMILCNNYQKCVLFAISSLISTFLQCAFTMRSLF